MCGDHGIEMVTLIGGLCCVGFITPIGSEGSPSRNYFMTDSQSVSQYVLVLSTLVGLATRYYFLSECCCLKFAVFFL
jgi:hypothetical protein